MIGLTPRHRELLEFFRSYRKEHGRSPTFAAASQALGISSKGNVVRMIRCLIERGHMAWKLFPHRHLVIITEQKETPEEKYNALLLLALHERTRSPVSLFGYMLTGFQPVVSNTKTAKPLPAVLGEGARRC